MKEILENKFDLKFNGKVDPFKYFFGHLINTITTEDALNEYAVNNFNGMHSMSNPGKVKNTIDLLNKDYRGKKHIDIGTSRGYLVKMLTEAGYESYGIDGCNYGLVNPSALDIPMSQYAVCDITNFDFKVLDLEKYFDISTAFEITEHIHEKDIKTFYDNVSHISKEHICSIHTGGVDSTMDINPEAPLSLYNRTREKHKTNHHNVKPTEWWLEFLSKYGEVSLVPEYNTPIAGDVHISPDTQVTEERVMEVYRELLATHGIPEMAAGQIMLGAGVWGESEFVKVVFK